MVTQNLLPITMRFRLLPLVLLACLLFKTNAQEPPTIASVGPFADPELPYLFTPVDARAWGPANNLTPRGIVLKDGDLRVCFDTDLLRISAAWIADGENFLTESGTVAGLSWADGRKKQGGGQTSLPTPIGTPFFTTGMVPGILPVDAEVVDPRTPAPDGKEVGRGPDGRWNHLEFGGKLGNKLSYQRGDIEVVETIKMSTQRGTRNDPRNFSGRFARTMKIQRNIAVKSPKPFAIVACRIPDNAEATFDGTTFKCTTPGRDDIPQTTLEITATSLALQKPLLTPVMKIRNGHLLVIPQRDGQRSPVIQLTYRLPQRYQFQPGQALTLPPPRRSYPPVQSTHWNNDISSHVKPATVFSDGWTLEEIPLPEPNPWKRRVRIADIDFSKQGQGFAVTTDGDVWRLTMDETTDAASRPDSAKWRRVAGGLSEPQSICVVDGEPYVFDRTGIIRVEYKHPELGPAHVLHNHCNLFAQTCNTREFPMAMERLGSDFIIAKGGQQAGTKGKHNGMVLRVPADGRSFEVIASGLRQPYIGVAHGRIYSSDQQGHWVPATPLHEIRSGQFYGSQESYPASEDFPEITEPLLWLPHQACQSGTGTLPFPGDTNSILYLDYYRGEVFRIATYQGQTSGHKRWSIPGPLLAGTIHDDDIYLCGYQVWGHAGSERDAGLWRLRRMEKAAAPNPAPPLPDYALASRQGVFVQHSAPLPPNAEHLEHWSLERWNYKRTAKYGSPLYKSDGTAGREFLYPSAALLSPDRTGIFLVVPGMAASDQLVVKHTDETNKISAVYLSPRTLPEAASLKLPVANLPTDISRLAPVKRLETDAPKEISIASGKALYTSMGCIACHSVDGTTAGKTGPSWKALADSKRTLVDGKKLTANDAYLRTAIYEPGKHKPVGYAAADIGMPSYLGLLDEDDVASLIRYIRSLE